MNLFLLVLQCSDSAGVARRRNAFQEDQTAPGDRGNGGRILLGPHCWVGPLRGLERFVPGGKPGISERAEQIGLVFFMFSGGHRH